MDRWRLGLSLDSDINFCSYFMEKKKLYMYIVYHHSSKNMEILILVHIAQATKQIFYDCFSRGVINENKF